MPIGTDCILTHRNSPNQGNLFSDLGSGQNTALSRLGTLTELDLKHFDLRMSGNSGQSFLAEPPLFVPHTKFGGANLKNNIAAPLKVVGRQTTFPGIQPATGFGRASG